VRARVIAGSAFGRTSPVGLRSEWLYAEVSLAAGARAPLDPDPEERAIYVVEGEVEIADVSRRRGIGGPPLYLVEFRVLAPGADRASQRRLEDREIRAGARRNRVHSASRILGKSQQLGNQILAHWCANSALFGHAPTFRHHRSERGAPNMTSAMRAHASLRTRRFCPNSALYGMIRAVHGL
jgi:hypothetical protein